MIHVTDSAAAKLQTLVLEHPDEPIVRIFMKDHSETQLQFTILLESTPEPEDEVVETNGLTIAIEKKSAGRMEGITLDYQEPEGFKFHHPDHGGEDLLRLINPN